MTCCLMAKVTVGSEIARDNILRSTGVQYLVFQLFIKHTGASTEWLESALKVNLNCQEFLENCH